MKAHEAIKTYLDGIGIQKVNPKAKYLSPRVHYGVGNIIMCGAKTAYAETTKDILMVQCKNCIRRYKAAPNLLK